jgi:hypothetical protein
LTGLAPVERNLILQKGIEVFSKGVVIQDHNGFQDIILKIHNIFSLSNPLAVPNTGQEAVAATLSSCFPWFQVEQLQLYQ